MTILIPNIHTRPMDRWSPASVVRHHLPGPRDDFDWTDLGDHLGHAAMTMEDAALDFGEQVVCYTHSHGPIFEGGVPSADRLASVRGVLSELLERAELSDAERRCAEDLLKLCIRYQTRMRIIRLAMAQADNPDEVIDWSNRDDA
jgi:hypothetical protein